MTQEQIKAALTKVISDAIMVGNPEGDWDAMMQDAAAAVMALVGPKPLVWGDRGDGYSVAETASGMAYITEYAGMENPFKLSCGRVYSQHPSLKAAQAAAQSLEDATHWGRMALAGMIGGK